MRSAGGLGVAENIFAGGTITGTLVNALTMAVSGTGLSGSASYNNSGAATFTVTSNATNLNTGSTVVARDGSGDFSAGTITATLSGAATTAGTITSQANSATIAAASANTANNIVLRDGSGDFSAGIATLTATDPALLMNSELNAGLPVALLGRVPVRVFGPVTKGQKVYADLHGRACRSSEGELIGIALEDNADEGEKLVECMLKL